MKVIAFNFDKLSVEKLKEKAENIKINTNIHISDIQEVKNELLKTKEELIQVQFSFNVKYDPGFAQLDMRGNILLSLEPQLAEEVSKEWKKKKMPEKFKATLFNIILRKSTIKALELEDQINLPLHLPLPTIKTSS